MLRSLLRVSIAILLLASLLLCAYPSSAAGIGVTPGSIEFSVRPGGIQVQTLHVINQDKQASGFEVYVEGINEKWFTVTPVRFTLKGQEQESVEIALAPSLMASPHEYNVSICVVSIPPSSDLRIGAGIKVPVQVQITKFPVMAIQWWIASAVILVVLVVGILILWKRKARRV